MIIIIHIKGASRISGKVKRLNMNFNSETDIPLLQQTIVEATYTVRPRQNRTLKQRDAVTTFRGLM